MSVPFYDFAKLHDSDFKKQIIQRITDIVENNSFVEGQFNTSFQKKFAELTESNHCLLVGNGTDALEISLQALDIEKGSYVAISSISFFATVECVVNQGLTPVFVDVDSDTGLMCPDSLERILAKFQVKAVIPVHIYGLPSPMAQINSICQSRGIPVIEDAAQAHGGRYIDGSPIGSSNNLSCFSFYPTKNLGAFGDAGAICTNSHELADKIIKIRNHGRSPEGHILYGRNSRCDHFQAAVLDLKLEKFSMHHEQRKQVASFYYKHLEGLPLRTPPQKYLDYSSWHLFPVQCTNGDEKYALAEYLKKHDIGNALFYEKALSQEKPCTNIKGEFERANNFALQTLCLPMNPFITEDQVKEVAKVIKSFFT